MSAHITEHVAFQYRKEIEKNLGVGMPSEDKPLPEDIEIEISRLAAQAAGKLLNQNQAEMAEEEARKQEQDPLTQIQQREIALKEAEFQHKQQLDLAKLQSDMNKSAANIAVQEERIESEERREGARLGMDLAKTRYEGQREDLRYGIELGKTITEEIDDAGSDKG